LDVASLVVGLLTGFLIIGVVAGWLATRRMRGGRGLAGSIAVGILGAYAGGFLFGLAPLNLEDGVIGAPIAAAVGAALAIWIAARVRRP
jgi:uncharacterized membrane protein YeaQ/YmgE (transglycosylase-associated protein family)